MNSRDLAMMEAIRQDMWRRETTPNTLYEDEERLGLTYSIDQDT